MPVMELGEWLTIYLKHQDMLKKSIKNIEVDGNVVLVEKEGETQEWLVEPKLELHNLDVHGIVTYNTKDNFKSLVNQWDAVSSKALKLVFANPKTNEKWVVVPGHHAKVADEKSFKAGLEAMFQSISEY